MCGVFGFVLGEEQTASKIELRELISAVFKQSYSRGKEASGIAIRSNDRIAIYKEAMSSVDLLRYNDFKIWLGRELDRLSSNEPVVRGPVTIIGHARLMTNGLQGINENNQPVYTKNSIVIHNGIIVNDKELYDKHNDLNRSVDVDSQLIPLLLDKYEAQGKTIATALTTLYEEAVGQIVAVVMRADRPGLLAGTNAGSLYTFDAADAGFFLCMSESQFLTNARNQSALLQRAFGGAPVLRHMARDGLVVDEKGKSTKLKLRPDEPSLATPQVSPSYVHHPAQLFDHQAAAADRRANLKRCSKCVLPETMPGINFDQGGVCNYCHSHKVYKPKGLDALHEALEPYRRTDGNPELIMGLSGGRDSSYGVHYVRRELGINLVTYTYDWALVTDLARRNISRMCEKLELENVLVSADIKQKRAYIRKNINAWLKDPQLGIVPLFMAGDKLFFYYYNDVKKRLGLDIAITCGNRFEKTDFKSGFCGVFNSGYGDGKSWRPYDVSAFKKLKYLRYFTLRMGKNPGYWNSSLWDNMKGFYASYLMKHNFIWLYDYLPWDEELIDSTLREEYDWENAGDTDSTWRVGDGTASFYNYIYLTAAGFTEHDTFRSNQIRDGVLNRKDALELIDRDNQPRYDSILEYSHLIGFDFDHAIATVNQMPKLY